MPIFRYKAYREGGAETAGTIEAANRADAVRRLKDAGTLPVEISGAESLQPSARRTLARERARRLPALTRDLATMLGSGVTLTEALEALGRDQEGAWQSMVVDLKDRVSGGSSLSKALGAYPEVFSPVYTGLVSAGEAGGGLAPVLDNLADFLERTDRIRSRVATALIYPVVMTLISAGVLSFLLTFVVPKIARVFERSRAELPWITRALVGLSGFFQQHWWWLLPAGVLGAMGLVRLASRFRERWDAVVLDLPVIGPTVRTLALGRFSRTFGMLLQGGVPVVKALEFAGAVTGNERFKRVLDGAARRVLEGATLSAVLGGNPLFPAAFVGLVSTGEKTGRIAEVLQRAADALDADLERKLSRAMAVFEPALIVAMGIAVGTIVVAILLPIFELNRLVG